MSKYMDQGVRNFLLSIKGNHYTPQGIFATILARSQNKRPMIQKASKKKRNK